MRERGREHESVREIGNEGWRQGEGRGGGRAKEEEGQEAHLEMLEEEVKGRVESMGNKMDQPWG
jgi:hypothetical protein